MAGAVRQAVAIELRLCHESDFPDVIELRGLAFEALAAAAYTAEQLEFARAGSPTPAYAEILRGCNLMLAIDVRGGIVGAAGWSREDGQPDMARIRKVFVHSSCARQGIGTRLVRDAEARAGAAGFRRLCVRASSNAVPFYRSLGYREDQIVSATGSSASRLTLMRMTKDPVASAL